MVLSTYTVDKLLRGLRDDVDATIAADAIKDFETNETQIRFQFQDNSWSLWIDRLTAWATLSW